MTSEPTGAEPSAAPLSRQYPYAPESNVLRPRTVAHTVGLVVSCVLAAVGVFAVAGAVLFVIALNSWGSNK